MPPVTREEAAILNLYVQCRNYHVLPVRGSLVEQPLRLMEYFDIMNRAIEDKKVAQVEEQKSSMEKERMKRELSNERTRR
jgi:hypothetical protein